MKQWILAGVILIFMGIGLFAYYDSFVKPEREAKELIVEAKMSYERGTAESINKAIDIFTRIIARYPKTESAFEAYYYIAQGYEKLNLNRLAYLKYIYLLKNNSRIPVETEHDIKARVARLKIMKRYDEEGVHQLLGLLNYTENKDFRSRVYTELGHTYLKKGELNKSKRMFDLALSENGNNEEAILGKARTYKRMGKDTMAYNLYDHFLKYYSNFSYYTDDITKSYNRQLYDSGINNYRRGRYYPAIEYFRKYLRQFPGTYRSENSLYWIGESYFALKKYDTAVAYFKRARSNGYYHKDQDAMIKTGYSYFMAKNYDLATREFQAYLDAYPNGKYVTKAKQWKSMSTKEMLYKYRKDDTIIQDEDLKEESEDTEKTGNGFYQGNSKTVKADFDINSKKDDYYDDNDQAGYEENMAEL
ncbi:MAG TPA: tetratricopeptide repeat protein [Spirochaetota bacterium]|nr:tetratricopeptide repeat protein [Spirochaetota bacterium]HPJ34988.1 tetratricopeptide repeat protein [Spirochaetota bacterium]